MDRTASDGIHLIGYSLGGLAVRYAVQHLGLRASALTAVTIGTPHHGTPWAKRAPGTAATQMHPDFALLATLPDLVTSHPVRWLLLYSDCDPMARPPALPPAGLSTPSTFPDADTWACSPLLEPRKRSRPTCAMPKPTSPSQDCTVSRPWRTACPANRGDAGPVATARL